MPFYSGIVSPSPIESVKAHVNNLNVASVDANAYGPARCVPLVNAESSLANIRSFVETKLVLKLQVIRFKTLPSHFRRTKQRPNILHVRMSRV